MINSTTPSIVAAQSTSQRLQTILFPDSAVALTDSIFRNPPVCYRGTPFWAWNGPLVQEVLREQLQAFQSMGFGGAIPHVRTGLAEEYLGTSFMEKIRFSLENAQSLGLRLPLYDEDRWPSGYAGGLLTRDPQHREKQLLFQPGEIPPQTGGDEVGLPGPSHPLARYAVVLQNGKLVSSRLLAERQSAKDGETEWCAYWRTATRSWTMNGYTYADTLCPATMRKFVQITHERYKAVVGGSFGKQIPFIFSDEPRFSPYHGLAEGKSRRAVSLPWTEDLPQTFAAAWGVNLLEVLPQIIWDRADGKPSTHRWQLFDHLTERFAAVWADIPAQWAEENRLPLTVKKKGPDHSNFSAG